MEAKRKKYPLALFALALPALIITDWYVRGFGIAMFFIFITAGLIIDQIQRMNGPSPDTDDKSMYKRNRSLKLAGMIFTVSSPLIIIYMDSDFKIPIFVAVLIFGAVLNWSAGYLFPAGSDKDSDQFHT